MSGALDLLMARVARVDLADLGATVRHLRDSGLDFSAVEAAAGGAYLCPVRAVEPRTFAIERGADLAVVIEARGQNGTDVLDLVAWRAPFPDRWRTLTGHAPAVGMARAASPSLYDEATPLRLWRNPAGWLNARCDGAALLHSAFGARWLLDLAPSAVAAEDAEHAAALHAERQRLTSFPILIPNDSMTEAAA